MPYSEYQNGAVPAGRVATILNAARVPNLLFGWWAVALYGISMNFRDLDFIVPDSHLDRAVRALANAGFRHCQDANCLELKVNRFTENVPSHTPVPVSLLARSMADNNNHEIADAHFHLEGQYTHFTTLSLFKQSRVLWSLDNLTLDPIGNDHPTFMFTNNVQRVPPRTQNALSGTGPWTQIEPVKTLTHHALVEAFMRLLCREYNDRGYRRVQLAWDLMYLRSLGGSAVDANGHLIQRLADVRRKLKPQFRELFDLSTVQLPEQGDLKRATNTLRDYLIAHEGLPDMPPPDTWHITFGPSPAHTPVLPYFQSPTMATALAYDTTARSLINLLAQHQEYRDIDLTIMGTRALQHYSTKPHTLKDLEIYLGQRADLVTGQTAVDVRVKELILQDHESGQRYVATPSGTLTETTTKVAVRLLTEATLPFVPTLTVPVHVAASQLHQLPFATREDAITYEIHTLARSGHYNILLSLASARLVEEVITKMRTNAQGVHRNHDFLALSPTQFETFSENVRQFARYHRWSEADWRWIFVRGREEEGEEGEEGGTISLSEPAQEDRFIRFFLI
ncbi:hypothetical protein BJY04DRAFT_213493 [Aspergillus karnatakaensis]|uniref:uncharacterized protein n=1 Tax=Aspergillus karnatakaensis TaxID=1810916 RepID=UPI003CCD2E5C